MNGKDLIALLEKVAEMQKKETAREILQKLYNETEYFSFQYTIKELAKEYGVEVEEWPTERR